MARRSSGSGDPQRLPHRGPQLLAGFACGDGSGQPESCGCKYLVGIRAFRNVAEKIPLDVRHVSTGDGDGSLPFGIGKLGEQHVKKPKLVFYSSTNGPDALHVSQ